MEATHEINLLSILVPLLVIVFIIAIGVVLMYLQFQKNIMKQQLKREALKNEHQQELIQKTVAVQEVERKRIAQDLHDELGAVLSISRMQLLQLESETHAPTERIRPIREMIETTLTSTRRISHELMPLQLEQLGLEQALQSLLSKAANSHQLTTNLAVSENTSELAWITQLGLYRIYSELIHNSLKHAGASTIDISVLREGNQLYGRYADDGRGLSDDKADGLGMKSLENRVNALNGHWDFGNRAQGGFYANIKIELKTTQN